MPAQLVPPSLAESRPRLWVALKLRGQRKYYREIGAHLGVTESRAHQMVAEAIALVTEDLKEAASDVLIQELAALDALAKRAWGQMEKGDTVPGKEDGFDVAAAMVVLRVMERRAKYLGLDAPQDMRVSLFNAPRGLQPSSEVDLDSLTLADLEELEAAELARQRILLKARKVLPDGMALDPTREVRPPAGP